MEYLERNFSKDKTAEELCDEASTYAAKKFNEQNKAAEPAEEKDEE